MTLRIHGIASSRAARALWMLEELGVPYEHVPQTYQGGATRTPAFLRLNPNGHIPVLEDGAIVVWESMAINLYLARRFGGSLAPADLAEEAQVLRWSFWVMTECEKDALTILFHRLIMPAERRNPALAEQAERALAGPLRVLDAHLAQQPWVAGSRFTVADINLASVLAWAKAAPALIEAHPRVAGWLAACLERPAQRKVQAMSRG
jgi:glutathione S-transferase